MTESRNALCDLTRKIAQKVELRTIFIVKSHSAVQDSISKGTNLVPFVQMYKIPINKDLAILDKIRNLIQLQNDILRLIVPKI